MGRAVDFPRSVSPQGLFYDASISMEQSLRPQQESEDNLPQLETELLGKLMATITDGAAPAAQMPAAGGALPDQPVVQLPPTLSPTSLKFMSQLEEATRDFARAGEFKSGCHGIEGIRAEPEVYPTRATPETEVAPNVSGVDDFEEYPNKTPSYFRRRFFISATVAVVAGLSVGATWAWRPQLALNLGRGQLQAAATSVNSLGTQPPEPEIVVQGAPAI